jgi:hypothetical protein
VASPAMTLLIKATTDSAVAPPDWTFFFWFPPSIPIILGWSTGTLM